MLSVYCFGVILSRRAFHLYRFISRPFFAFQQSFFLVGSLDDTSKFDPARRSNYIVGTLRVMSTPFSEKLCDIL